jgi:hypothetical protein
MGIDRMYTTVLEALFMKIGISTGFGVCTYGNTNTPLIYRSLWRSNVSIQS